jgi:hypothetical protein
MAQARRSGTAFGTWPRSSPRVGCEVRPGRSSTERGEREARLQVQPEVRSTEASVRTRYRYRWAYSSVCWIRDWRGYTKMHSTTLAHSNNPLISCTSAQPAACPRSRCPRSRACARVTRGRPPGRRSGANEHRRALTPLTVQTHGRAILVLTNHACHHARSQCHMLKGPSVSRVVLRGCCRAHRSSASL